MADYWKSGERHHCSFCKCWLAGNKVSIELHERGNNHKNNVKAKLEQLRRDKIEKERQDKQMSSTLADIERAAAVAYQRDVASESSGTNSSTDADAQLPSKLKRPSNGPVQIQLKKPKFVLKTPTAKPVFVPISTEKKEEEKTTTTTPTESSEPEPEPAAPSEGVWYESKTDNQESFFWNDTTGESSWTPPPVYLSIEDQRAKGLKV